MITVEAEVSDTGILRVIKIEGHAEDPRVCASVSMAVSISRKLLGGSPIDRNNGGGSYIVTFAGNESSVIGMKILSSLITVAKSHPDLEVVWKYG